MKKILVTIFASTLLFSCGEKNKATKNVENVVVTEDNYVEAETDWNFLELKKTTPINEWLHKEPVTMENQTIIRSNADVVYSLAAVDVSKGATFSIPKRENGALQLMQLIDENHYTRAVIFAGETTTLTKDDLSSGNYVYILARTRISDDLEETKRAQQSMKIEANSAIPYTAKGYNAEEVEKMRNTLIQNIAQSKVEVYGYLAFGESEKDVEQLSYIHGAALGWGGLPAKYAQYTSHIKGQGSDAKNQSLTFPKPDLDFENGGFLSLTTYNSESWIGQKNFYIGMEDMKDNGDGTVTVEFNSGSEYSVDVEEGWNGTIRLYLPKDWKECLKSTKHLMEIPVAKK